MHETRGDDWRRMGRLTVAFAGAANMRLVERGGSSQGAAPSNAEGAAVAAAAAALIEALPATSLVLLWPEGARVPAALERSATERLGYPVPQAVPAAVDRTVVALRALRCDGAVVLAASGATPFLPAYLCYLAGIERRAAMTAEFGGGVLSDVVGPPAEKLGDQERHLFLLRALGLVAGERALRPAEPAYVATGVR